MDIFKGIPAAKGIAIGRAFIFQPHASPSVARRIENVDNELSNFHAGLQKADQELADVYTEAVKNTGKETAEIFQAHRMMLHDPDLLAQVELKITVDHLNGDAAFYQAAEAYAVMLENVEDEYLRARSADIRDVSARMIRILRNETAQTSLLTEPAVIIAGDLTPSDTIQFNPLYTLGFFTAKGGTTSHTAILSRALGIPAVVGAGQIAEKELQPGALVILDGDEGRLIVSPDEKTLQEYTTRQQKQSDQTRKELQAALNPAITPDGKMVEIVANIGNLADAKRAIQNGAAGVGLFRTEFSYIEKNSIPKEQELLEAYQAIFQIFGEYPILVRTLDIGGDKEMSHLDLPIETNPFLGCRGIRLCIARPDLFKPQLRAILRAGIDRNLRIMFPMVATLGEVRQAKNILRACMAELAAENKPYNPKPQLGIMIEVPAAALCADQLAREVDFFSIGTNDLTQYTLAVDRTNSSLSYLASALQPAVLRLIQRVIECGHQAGIWVGLCGELAGDPQAIPVLLGLGLDEFSMNPAAIPQAKEVIRKWHTGKAKAISAQVMSCETLEQVQDLLLSFQN